MYVNKQHLGWMPTQIDPTASTQNLNATNTKLAFSFYHINADTLSKFRFYLSAIAGSLAENDISVGLYSDNGGKPGNLIESRNTLEAPAAVGFNNVIGFTSNLTANTQYWLVITNNNANPSVNYPTINWIPKLLENGMVNATDTLFGFSKSLTTDGGATWGTNAYAVAGYRIDFSSGCSIGLPVVPAGTLSNFIYGTNEIGVKLTIPNYYPRLRISGVSLPFYKNNSPAGNIGLRLVTAAGTYNTNVLTPAQVSSSPIYGRFFNFANPIKVCGGETIRITCYNSATDSSSNCYRSNHYQCDTDPKSLSLFPFGGTMQRTATVNNTANPIAWTDSAYIIPLVIGLQSDLEFESINNYHRPRRSLGRI